MTLLRRCFDATVLLVVVTNIYHFAVAAVRLWLSKRGLHNFDDERFAALIAEYQPGL